MYVSQQWISYYKVIRILLYNLTLELDGKISSLRDDFHNINIHITFVYVGYTLLQFNR